MVSASIRNAVFAAITHENDPGSYRARHEHDHAEFPVMPSTWT
jgi:hypothetical protein